MWQVQTRRVSGLVFALAGLLSVRAMSAVDEGTSLQEDTVVAGVYDLVTAAGRDLPAVVSENSTTGYKQEIVGGSVTLREDHTFHWTTRYRYTESAKVTTVKVQAMEPTKSSATALLCPSSQARRG